MALRGSLRGRIVAAFTLLAVAVCSFFALIAFVASQKVDYRYLVEHRMGSMVRWELARLSNGQDTDLPPGLAFHTGSQIPDMLRSLGPGFHEVEEQDVTWHVLIGVTPNGERYAAVDEVSDFKRIEREVMIWLGVGILSSVLLAVLLGRAIAGRVIAPVTALAYAVRDETLDDAAPALTRRDEIGVLAQAFAARTTQLGRFLERERLFTGDVSHELRTPLTVILGASEVLQARLWDRPELLAPVERILRTAQETADRVGALLLLSRTPAAIDAPRTRLLAVIDQEVERYRPLLAGKPVEFVFDERHETWVFAHPALAGMAIGNLVRNACQYTESGRVLIRVARDALVLEDTGPGLGPTLRAQLFERFVRVAKEGDGGAGLGLAIVKRIVEHLGWSIELESPEGGGSRFLIRFVSSRDPRS